MNWIAFKAGLPGCEDDSPDKGAVGVSVHIANQGTRTFDRLRGSPGVGKVWVGGGHSLTSKVGAPALLTIMRLAARKAGEGGSPAGGSSLR